MTKKYSYPKIYLQFAFYCFLLFFAQTACQTSQENTPSQKPYLLATTGMIADIIKNITLDSAKIESLMGAGVDPHLYKATRQDLEKMRQAEVIFYNGLYLEGKMGEVLEKLGKQKPVYAVAEGISPQKILQEGTAADPHLWFDVQLWAEVTQFAAKKLIAKYPQNTAYFQKNTAAYLQKLKQLDQEVKQQLQTIPKAQRVLITAHDAFGYFGKAYQVEVKALQGISTLSEFGLKDIKELVDFIVNRKIKAVFVETSIPQKSLEAVVSACQEKGHDLKIGGTLYSDAMGEENTEEGTYIGMVRANVNTIIKGLK